MTEIIEINQPFLSRVEGHGGITVNLDEKGVSTARVNIFEGSRFFEKIVVGKYFHQVPEIVCRICSICSASHKIVSIQAVEDALGIRVSEDTVALRKLLHYGGLLESHALHIFLLAIPDYENVPSALHLLPRLEKEYHMGMGLKNLGNTVQKQIGGHTIHMPEPVIGGFSTPPDRNALENIIKMTESAFEAARKGLEMLSISPPEIPLKPIDSFLSVTDGPDYPYMGRIMILSRGNRSEQIPLEKYMERLDERVVPWSRAKQCFIDDRPFMVGALARVLTNFNRFSREARLGFLTSRALLEQRDPLSNNVAQAIETLDLLEKIRETARFLLQRYPLDIEPVSPTREQGEGWGLVEAPRGILIHHYRIEGGKVKWANILTPTALNLASMEEEIRFSAREMEELDPRDIQKKLEIIPRAYDPCISCSVH